VSEDEHLMGKLGYHTSEEVGHYNGQHDLGLVASQIRIAWYYSVVFLNMDQQDLQ
jgi:hypothetical protein